MQLIKAITMPRKTKFSIAKPKIVKSFQFAEKSIYGLKELQLFFDRYRYSWDLAQSMNFEQFIVEAKKEIGLEEHIFNFPRQKKRLFSWGPNSFRELLLALGPQAYFSHYSALQIHNLTEQLATSHYLSIERKQPTVKTEDIHQTAIDSAFKKAQRISTNFCQYKREQVFLLKSANQGQLGIEQLLLNDQEQLRVSNLERTLIDCSIRPAYSGGVLEIIKAFELAKEQLSINRLTSYLKRMKLNYPYHQAIGFYLEISGYPQKDYEKILQRFKIEKRFYLNYQMKETSFSEKWQLFYPKHLIING